MALLNYNRSIITNFADSTSVPLTGTNTLILEFGLFVPVATNFLELLTSIGWEVTNTSGTLQPTLVVTIEQDGSPIASANQESIPDGEDEDLEMVTSFQTVLTNVTAGHHVYSVFVRNSQPLQGDISVTGPANISGKVIG